MTQQFQSKYSLKRNEDVCSHRDLYLNVHKSLSHNSQKLETTAEWIHNCHKFLLWNTG